MREIAQNFSLDTPIESIRVHGNGNVNDTYLVTCEGGGKHAILQRVNTYVFTQPERVMMNMHKATKHLAQCVVDDNLDWRVQRVIPSREGRTYWRAEDGTFWRMISFIENSESFDTIYTHS